MRKEVTIGIVSALLTAFILYITNQLGAKITNKQKEDLQKNLAENRDFQSNIAKLMTDPSELANDERLLDRISENLQGNPDFLSTLSKIVSQYLEPRQQRIRPYNDPQEQIAELSYTHGNSARPFLMFPPPRFWISGPNEDENDSGLVEGRVLDFRKIDDRTAIRIGYTDNLRVMGAGVGCQWEILIDGRSCPSGKLTYGYYAAPAQDNAHRSRHVVGYCEGLPSGDHSIQVLVGEVPGIDLGDCRSGWKGTRWTLEVQEIPPNRATAN